MQEAIQFLIQHGYIVIFLGMLVQQVLPVPTFFLLLAAGVLINKGYLIFGTSSGIAVAATLLGDVLGYLIGQYRGDPVLALICRISFNRDSCIRQTTLMFSRHGAFFLIVAKFIPGFNMLTAPLAGISRIHLWHFLLIDGFGSFFWVVFYIGLGYLLTDEIEGVATYALRLGMYLGFFVAGCLAVYIFWKYFRRQKYLRESGLFPSNRKKPGTDSMKKKNS